MAYKMTHPDGGEIHVEAGSVEVYESQGWTTSPKANPPVEPDESKKK